MAYTASNRIKLRVTDLLAGFTIRALLLNGYVPDADHTTASQLTGEISGNGYERQTVTGLVSTQDDASNHGVLDSNDIGFGLVGPPGGQPVTKLALVRRLGASDVDANDEIIAVLDCLATLDGTSFTVVVNANGLVRVI